MPQVKLQAMGLVEVCLSVPPVGFCVGLLLYIPRVFVPPSKKYVLLRLQNSNVPDHKRSQDWPNFEDAALCPYGRTVRECRIFLKNSASSEMFQSVPMIAQQFSASIRLSSHIDERAAMSALGDITARMPRKLFIKS